MSQMHSHHLYVWCEKHQLSFLLKQHTHVNLWAVFFLSSSSVWHSRRSVTQSADSDNMYKDDVYFTHNKSKWSLCWARVRFTGFTLIPGNCTLLMIWSGTLLKRQRSKFIIFFICCFDKDTNYSWVIMLKHPVLLLHLCHVRVIEEEKGKDV